MPSVTVLHYTSAIYGKASLYTHSKTNKKPDRILNRLQNSVLFPAISWGGFSLQNPKSPPEKHPKYKKH